MYGAGCVSEVFLGRGCLREGVSSEVSGGGVWGLSGVCLGYVRGGCPGEGVPGGVPCPVQDVPGRLSYRGCPRRVSLGGCPGEGVLVRMSRGGCPSEDVLGRVSL